MIRVSSNSRSPLQAGHTSMRFSSSSIMDPPPSSPGSPSAPHLLAEPLERQLQSGVGVHARLPAEAGAGAPDVGLADLGVVLGQRTEDDLAAGTRQTDDALGQLQERQLLGIADVDRIAAAPLHQLPEA